MVMNIFLCLQRWRAITHLGKNTHFSPNGVSHVQKQRTPSAQNAASSTVSRMIVITEANSPLKCKQALNVTVYLGKQSKVLVKFLQFCDRKTKSLLLKYSIL